MTPTPKEIAVAIKLRRGDKGLREAAKQVGVSTATLCRAEQGKDMRLSHWRKIELWLTR